MTVVDFCLWYVAAIAVAGIVVNVLRWRRSGR